MITVNVKQNRVHEIGYQGENDRTQVRFDLSDIMAEFPGGAATLIVLRPGDETPFASTNTAMDGESLVWTVAAYELANDGDLEAQIVYSIGGVIAKTKKYTFVIKDTLLGNAEEPPDWEDWVGVLISSGNAVIAAITDAQQTIDAAVAAAEAAKDEAEAAVDHYPYINSTNHHWMVYNAALGVFEDTGVDASGDPTLIINDNAGSGVHDKTWSAHKLVTELDLKAPKAYPVFTGHISLGRALGPNVGSASIAVGVNAEASGYASNAFGNGTQAQAPYSEASGTYSKATSSNAHAEGYYTTASGTSSHAEGDNSTASGEVSHAEGASTTSSGDHAHVEGELSQALANDSHAEGYMTVANAYAAHAEGNQTRANGTSSHAEGQSTVASGYTAHAEGNASAASGNYSHSEGNSTTASGPNSHAEGASTTASGNQSHSEGAGAIASGANSHAEGAGTTASGAMAHAEGAGTSASGNQSHAEGVNTTASGSVSHAEGDHTVASGDYSHAEGEYSESYGGYGSHAEGYRTEAHGYSSHSEGAESVAYGDYSHAEGLYSYAGEQASHAEGIGTTANGSYSHVVGSYNVADTYSDWPIWAANTSYAVGDKVQYTIYGNTDGYICKTANSDSSFTSSKWTKQNRRMDFAEIVGNGTANLSRSNARALDWEGNEYLKGDLYVHCNPDSTGGSKLISSDNPEFTGSISMGRKENTTVGENSVATGWGVEASGGASHAEGSGTKATTVSAHAEGSSTQAIAVNSHAEGASTTASGTNSHAEGANTTASGAQAHAEGASTIASGTQSHAEGGNSNATSFAAHAEGAGTTASGAESHAEGASTNASGAYSHAEGVSTSATGAGSHAEGAGTIASGNYSHAEGESTTAAGANSHAGGMYNVADNYDNWPEWVENTGYSVGDKVKRTVTSNNVTTVTGYICKTANTDSTFRQVNWINQNGRMNYAEIIGNGGYSSPSNARALDWDGNEYLKGNLYVGCDSTSSGGSKVATEAQVNQKIALSQKGASNGVAELDANGKVPAVQLPGFVDDVIEVVNYDALPVPGESGKIYITLNNNKTYRWSGSNYVEISSSLALGETSSTAYRGDRGKIGYDHATDSGRIGEAQEMGLYKVSVSAEGHVSNAVEVQKADITALGIPGDLTDLINDNAGDGDTSSTWSADKLTSELSAKYEKPGGGIPASDLANGVLTSVIDDTAGDGNTSVTWSANKLYNDLEGQVVVSTTQPTQTGNKLWINDSGTSEYSIPTYAEHQALQSQIQDKPDIDSSTETGVDLDLSDENGNVILRMKNGEVQTKKFNSAYASGTKQSDYSGSDMDVSDEIGNVIARFKKGYILTKNFNSAKYGAKVITLKANGTGDFSTLKAALDSITDANPDDNPYEIHVYPGTYNTLDGFTEEEIQSADIGGGYTDNSMVGAKTKDGISIIGIGNRDRIILVAELDTTNYTSGVRGNISTLNCKGTGRFENLTIKAKNIRYCVHDDFACDHQYRRIFKNCAFIGENLSYNPATTYGGGIATGGMIGLFDSCDFGYDWGLHARQGGTGCSVVEVRNCTGNKIRIGDPTNNDDTGFANYIINGCNFKKLVYAKSNGATQHIDVSGSGNAPMMESAPDGFIIRCGDIVKTKCTTSVPSGTMVGLASGASFMSTASDTETAIGVVIGSDSNYDYVQTRGYINSALVNISGLGIGDYVTVDSDMALTGTGATSSNAVGVVKWVDSDSNAYIWMLKGEM